MEELNPYEVLHVPRDAGVDAIEDAYDSLFDEYESRAQWGDKSATDMLHKLNEARDRLVDPELRAQVDAALTHKPLSSTIPQNPAQAAPAAEQPKATPTPQARQAEQTTSRSTTAEAERMRVRRRSQARPRAVQPVATSSRLPYVLVSALAVALAGALLFLLLRPSQPAGGNEDRGAILATVNGAPIYDQDFQERLEIDRNTALADPLFSPFFNNFEGITGTRALNILKYDALDKLINLEVILQQAHKEGLYPQEAQQQSIINEAKAREVPAGQTFEAFLQQRNITAGQYNRKVISNVVYTLMANEHLPKEGDANTRTDGFIKWICDTRKNYDVRILMTLTEPAGSTAPPVENVPCTSGLPTDLPLPGVEEAPPEPEQTAIPPIDPGTVPG
ncbi:MAG TPA: SurA N-terminal domain-containing protein, partial [Chloroflexia bacterium]|nr:SurA N-terminal domain-containing protein [Chloroflexia bacterium]